MVTFDDWYHSLPKSPSSLYLCLSDQCNIKQFHQYVTLSSVYKHSQEKGKTWKLHPPIVQSCQHFQSSKTDICRDCHSRWKCKNSSTAVNYLNENMSNQIQTIPSQPNTKYTIQNSTGNWTRHCTTVRNSDDQAIP